MVAAGRIVVAPFDAALLARLRDAPIVIRVAHHRDVEAAIDAAARMHVDLHSLWVETPAPLCAIDLGARWRESRIALFVATAGTYQEFKHHVASLRRLRTRVFLPATSNANVLAVRVLASFGVRAAIVLRAPVTAWDAVTDLMTYALAAGRHAPIEPFEFIAAYRSRAGEYSSVYFDDPSVFVHVDRQGRVAATPDDLRLGRFVSDRIEDVRPEDLHRTRTPIGACIGCPGWGVCRGRFEEAALHADHCRQFFSQLAELLLPGRDRA